MLPLIMARSTRVGSWTGSKTCDAQWAMSLRRGLMRFSCLRETAPLLQEIPGRERPALVLRTDIANIYGPSLPRTLFSELVGQPVEQALRLDAACVVVNLLLLPDEPEIHRACIRNITALKHECDLSGMPLMIEPLVMQDNSTAGGYMVDGDIDKILPLVRQAAELGADIIKADPCDNVAEYHRVVEIAQGARFWLAAAAG